MRFIQVLAVIAALCVFPLWQSVMSAEPPAQTIPASVKVTPVEGITEYQLANGFESIAVSRPQQADDYGGDHLSGRLPP